MRPLLLLPLCLFLALAGAPHVWADDDDDDDRADHDRARAALERGEIMSLRTIMEKAETDYPGRLLEVELESKHGRFVYDIEILAADGRLVELLYDAADGKLLKAKAAGKDLLKEEK